MADSANARTVERPDEDEDEATTLPPRPARPAAAPTGAAQPRRRRRGWLRPTLFALLPVALLAGGWTYVTGGAVMATDNAYVRADIVNLATDVSGIVRSIEVHENQAVARGDVLFRLDDLPMRLALTRADAQVGVVRNELLALQANYRDMQAQIAEADADLAFYQAQFARQEELSRNDYASKAAYDAARHDRDVARQKLSSLQQQLAGIAASLDNRPDQPVERHPRYLDAVAAKDEAARQLDHTVVRAPLAGIVTNVPSLQVGDYLEAATPAFSLVATDHLWIEASPKETELTYVRPGQHASVWVDTYPGTVWQGEVESISPASGASFSLLPAQNTSGNWVKVVQRIPMRVRIENDPGKPPLRAGMSVELEVDTGHPRGLPTFLTDLFGGTGASHG